jgi:hypothetical protein
VADGAVYVKPQTCPQKALSKFQKVPQDEPLHFGGESAAAEQSRRLCTPQNWRDATKANADGADGGL